MKLKFIFWDFHDFVCEEATRKGWNPSSFARAWAMLKREGWGLGWRLRLVTNENGVVKFMLEGNKPKRAFTMVGLQCESDSAGTTTKYAGTTTLWNNDNVTSTPTLTFTSTHASSRRSRHIPVSRARGSLLTQLWSRGSRSLGLLLSLWSVMRSLCHGHSHRHCSPRHCVVHARVVDWGSSYFGSPYTPGILC
jgi:hypothetical protein